jgi:acyl-CoA reductase-like NAD-dependent aldehyde dehydrogenase
MTTTTAAVPTSPRHYASLVAGQPRTAMRTIDRYAPGTGVKAAIVDAADAATVDAAVTAARHAFDEGPWPRMTGFERAAVLNRVADLIDAHADELAALDAEEGGKPLRLARGDIGGAATLTRYAAALTIEMRGNTFSNSGPDFTGLVLREPIGVAALIIPWNFPALILCQKLPFALGAGCTVVVKPSELTTGSALKIAEFYAEAGLPTGALNVVTGDGEAGGALTEHPGVDLISFTGSTATGRRVVAASQKTLTKVHLELGGKAASLVFADADLDDAADGVLFGAYFNCGECCVSQSRLLVAESIAGEFTERLAASAARLKVGQPLDATTDVGPMIHSNHLAKVLSYVDAGRSAGARVAAGGERAIDGDLAAGLYVQPTILDSVTPEMTVFNEEIFGPVLTVTTFRDAADAIAKANAVQYGLSNSMWSKDIDHVLDVAKALKSGTVYVNTAIDAPPNMPFGGYKASGYGREMGQAGFDEYTTLKSVNIRTGRRAGTFAITAPRAARA